MSTTIARIAGRTIERVHAVGKHLLMQFSGDLVLQTHMRMSGSWHIYRPGERWLRPRADMRILIEADAFVAVGFSIPVAEFHTSRSLSRSRVAALGSDLLGSNFDPVDAVSRLRERSRMTIADALLDQQALAGIGNIYKSETLFLSAVLPLRRVSDLRDEELSTIVATAGRIMRDNVRDGAPAAIVTCRGLRRTRGSGSGLWVYHRAGKPCRRCGTPIRVRRTGLDARSTYWCPTCQK